MDELGADGKPNGRGPLRKVADFLRTGVTVRSILITFVALGVAVGVFVAVGAVPISADQPDGWLATHGLHFVFKRSVAFSSGRVTPPEDLSSPSRVRLAAQHFDMVCANCHGRPGFGQSVTALSMSPRPQYLPKVIDQFTDRELYTIVEHGVKFSAMPSWTTDARGDEVWSMVAFLRRLPKLDAAAYRELTALPDGATPVLTAANAVGGLRSANAERNAPPKNEFLYAAPAAGFGDTSIGSNPAATCGRCHGGDGSGAVTGGEAPNLTIQEAGYLKASLDAYVSGARKSGFMQTIAAQLSESQIAALADHYATLPVRTAQSAPADPALVKSGEAIARGGIRENATPACSLCHESAGASVSGAPHIAGQSSTYLRRQLGALANGGRGSVVRWNPMSSVAHALSDKDIAALAAYYSQLPPSKSAPPTGQQDTSAAGPRINLAETKQLFDSRCTQCHLEGGRGDGPGNFPNLTIQTKTYAEQNLYSFHIGARPGSKMRQATQDLNFDQMTSLATYVDGLAPRTSAGPIDRAAAQRGAAIATQGIASRGTPACLSCHGAKGVAALPLIPMLQGQNVGYLRRRLGLFATQAPSNRSTLNPMPAIARQLTAKERADLAAYFAATPPLPKPAARL